MVDNERPSYTVAQWKTKTYRQKTRYLNYNINHVFVSGKTGQVKVVQPTHLFTTYRLNSLTLLLYTYNGNRTIEIEHSKIEYT